MTFTPHGKHLIAGAWVAGAATFPSSPAHGPSHDFSLGAPADVDAAAKAAEEAFESYGYSTRADAITQIGTQETGLPEAHLQGERGRATAVAHLR